MSLTVKRAALKWVKKNELLVTINDEYGNFHSINIRINGMDATVSESVDNSNTDTELNEEVDD